MHGVQAHFLMRNFFFADSAAVRVAETNTILMYDFFSYAFGRVLIIRPGFVLVHGCSSIV